MIAFIASTVAGSTTGNNVTTSGINTTGANLLVVSLAFLKGATSTLTDSKSNTWTGLTLRASSSLQSVRLFYCFNPIVGTGHTFTATGTSDYPCLAVAAFSGVNVSGMIQESGFTSGAVASGAATVQPGSLTPSVDGSLIICGVNISGTSPSFNSGLTGVLINSVGGQCWGGGLGYLIQSTAAAINPTLSWTNASSGERAIGMATFMPVGFRPWYAQQSQEQMALAI